MVLDYQQTPKFPFFNRGLVLFAFILAVIILITGINIWNGRYDAGYKAGAGEGAAYKKIYIELNENYKKVTEENKKLAKRNTNLETQVASYSTWKNPFSPSSDEVDFIAQGEELSRKIAEVDQMKDDLSQQAMELGEMLGKAQRDEQRVVELNASLKVTNNLLGLSIGINIFLLIATFALIGYVFLRSYGIIAPPDIRREYIDKQEISISPSDEFRNDNALDSGQDGENPKALKSRD